MNALQTTNFRRGGEQAREATKGGGSFARTHYFSIEDGKSAILRFITDEPQWIVVDQHANVPTRERPSDWPEGSNWPQKMAAVCRRDVAFDGMFADCYICDHIVDGKAVKRPTGRVWAYAVLREEVIEGGQVVGIRDVEREVIKTDESGKGTGETTMEKAIVVVNMGFKNFFGALQGFAAHYKGTIVDRDFLIKRTGTGTDTNYHIIPLDPIDAADGKRFDLRNPEHAARYPLPEPLEAVVTSRADDDFYARFFDKRVPQPETRKSESKDGESSDAPKGAEAPAKSNDSTTVNLAALRDRVVPAASQEPSQEPAPAEAPASGGMRNFD